MRSFDHPAPRIQDYGLIGDCRAAALVSRHGSIDWLCWPRFDSPSIFAALIDEEKGGYWSIRPANAFQADRSYVQASNVLQTRFVCPSGRATLVDLMPVASEDFKRKNLLATHELVRQVSCEDGEISIEVEFCPRADYGSRAVRIRSLNQLGLRADVGRGAYWLRSNRPLTIDPDAAGARARVHLQHGDVLQFSLTYAQESPSVLPAMGASVQAAIDRSVQWWQDWAARSRYRGRYADEVARSALALKLLTYAPSGSIVAAPTSSLPERIGGSLNWDYRYCWLRDASLTIRGMLGLGYFDEAQSFLTWLLHATRLTQPELRVLYTLFGDIAPQEKERPELSGYCGSRPVRVGNGARKQFQLDIYGEVIEAAAEYAEKLGGFDRTTQKVLIGFGNYVADHWDQPDEGIWEPRSGRSNHTHSRLMCWTAMDRLLALSDKRLLKNVPREKFSRERDRIRQQIQSRGWNENLQSYASVLDGDKLDASLLRLAWYGFERADCARMKATYTRIREALCPADSLLYRYERQPSEGTFALCGFWGVEYLAIGGGTLEQAHEAFQSLLGYRNDLGLFGEEIDPQSGDALGNFPQAFSHVGLISAALTLAEKERGESHPAAETGTEVKSSGGKANA